MTSNSPVRKTSVARASRRTFGGIRKLPSGRYQVRYNDHAGRRLTAPHTFATKREADAWVATSQADLLRGSWRDPDIGSQTLATYLADWLATRTDLAPRTLETYADVSRRWITADLARPPRGNRDSRPLNLGAMQLRQITVADVREWYAAAVHFQWVYSAERTARGATNRRDRRPTSAPREWARANGRTVAATGRLSPDLVAAWRAAGSPSAEPIRPTPEAHPKATAQIAQAYRCLRACLNAAVRDGLIVVNPCQVARAAEVRAPERVPATAAEVQAIAAAMPAHLSTAVHLAAFTGLRAGELFALSREHVDLNGGTVRVERALLELRGRAPSYGPPKTAASRRTVHVPPHVVSLLASHMATFTARGRHALIFANDDGTPIRTNQRTRHFARARRAVGRDDLRWHDLRHTGATLAAQAGASIRELQHRLGHTTYAAAMRYQHASADRDREIASRLSELATPTVVSGSPITLRKESRNHEEN